MAKNQTPKTTKFIPVPMYDFDPLKDLREHDVVLFDTADMHIRGGHIESGGDELLIDSLRQGALLIPLSRSDVRIHAALRPLPDVTPPNVDGLYRLTFIDETELFAFRTARPSGTVVWTGLSVGGPQFTVPTHRLDQVTAYTFLSHGLNQVSLSEALR